VLAPVLLVRGEYDGIATVADLEEFYNKLPNGDRQLIILPNTAHSVALAINRQLFWHVTRAFLTMPTPVRGFDSIKGFVFGGQGGSF
jgi:alpha-beta hydrolase superfamily lysophospholipase